MVYLGKGCLCAGFAWQRKNRKIFIGQPANFQATVTGHKNCNSRNYKKNRHGFGTVRCQYRGVITVPQKQKLRRGKHHSFAVNLSLKSTSFFRKRRPSKIHTSVTKTEQTRTSSSVGNFPEFELGSNLFPEPELGSNSSRHERRALFQHPARAAHDTRGYRSTGGR